MWFHMNVSLLYEDGLSSRFSISDMVEWSFLLQLFWAAFRKFLQGTSKKGSSWSMLCTRTVLCVIFPRSPRLGLIRFENSGSIQNLLRKLCLCAVTRMMSPSLSHSRSVVWCCTQPTLIIWGEYDQIFPIELAHRLKRFCSLASRFIFPQLLFWRKPFLYENSFLKGSSDPNSMKKIKRSFWESNRTFRMSTPATYLRPFWFLNEETGNNLKLVMVFCRHLEGNERVEMVIIKDAGHAPNAEKPKEMSNHLKSFLIDSLSQSNQ